jgi:predicted membrane metal-binding protein
MAPLFREIFKNIIGSSAMQADKTIILPSTDPIAPSKRPSRARLGVAFGVAAVSDLFAIFTTIAPPAQVALDVGTASVLFLILGRRWALLPGLIAEAIPGMGVFPVWVLVVLSIAVYDGIKRPPKS